MRAPALVNRIRERARVADRSDLGDVTRERQPDRPVGDSADLSRRTRIYTGYVKINNDSNASYNFNINAYPGSAGASPGSPVGGKPGGFVMGMFHDF